MAHIHNQKLLEVACHHIVALLLFVKPVIISFSLKQRSQHATITLFLFFIQINIVTFHLHNSLRKANVYVAKFLMFGKLYSLLYIYLMSGIINTENVF